MVVRALGSFRSVFAWGGCSTLRSFPGRGRTGSNMNPARREGKPTGERGLAAGGARRPGWADPALLLGPPDSRGRAPARARLQRSQCPRAVAVSVARGAPAQGRAHLVVEVDPRPDDAFGVQPASEFVEGLVLQQRHRRSMMLSRNRPRPRHASSTRSAKATLVNCLGSSGRRNSTVLKGFHVPPILLDTRLARATGSRKKEVGS